MEHGVIYPISTHEERRRGSDTERDEFGRVCNALCKQWKNGKEGAEGEGCADWGFRIIERQNAKCQEI